MFDINARATDDQPINASMLGEDRFITSWVTPESLAIKQAHKAITNGIDDYRQRIEALWRFVRDIPYVQFVSSRVSIGGRTIRQDDVWLDPAQALVAGQLNCFNKSALLASLIKQETENVYVCLNNVTYDGVGGHAIVYLPEGDFVMETTNPHIIHPWERASDIDIYEPVIFFNDKEVRAVPGVDLEQPLGYCCVRWLEEYTNAHLCDSYI